MYLIFKGWPLFAENDHKILIYVWIAKSATDLVSPNLNYIQVKFDVNQSICFEVIGQNVIWSGWFSGSGNGSSWQVLQFRVLIDNIDLTWHHVAECSHLATSMMTIRQTHSVTHTNTHTHTHTHTHTFRQSFPSV